MSQLVDGLGILRQMRASDGRLQGRQVNLDLLLVFRVCISLKHRDLTAYAPLDVCHRLFIDRENAVLCARLDRHVTDRKAVVHGQGGDALAHKLHRLIQCAVHADLADDVQDHVLAGHPWAEFALQHKFDCARHLEPRLARRHTGGEVGRANAGRERAQRAVSTGVAVRSDNELARRGQAFFGQQRVLNAHRTHVKKVDDIVLLGKFAALEALLSGFYVLIRCKMIHDERNFGVVEYLVKARLLHLADRNRAGDIVCKRQIHVCLDQLPCRHAVQSRMLCEDFLRHCHAHNRCFLLPSVDKILVDTVDIRLDRGLDHVGRYTAAGHHFAAVDADLGDRLGLRILAVGHRA